jgi:hypothetical protein
MDHDPTKATPPEESEGLKELRRGFDVRKPANMLREARWYLEQSMLLKKTDPTKAKRYEKASKRCFALVQEPPLTQRQAGFLSKGTKGSKRPDVKPVTIDKELLLKRRGDRSQQAMALSLGTPSQKIPRTTYVNIETKGQTSLKTARQIADSLKVDLKTFLIQE